MLYLNHPNHHPYHNKNKAKQYLDSLPSTNINQRYYSGEEKFTDSFFDKLKISFNIFGHLEQLIKFYPYQTFITQIYKNYRRDMMNTIQKALAISAISIATIYQLGRRGRVLPFLKQYGTYFKTHRIFRHYILALIVPPFVLTGLVDNSYYDITHKLWSVHARRLQHKITQDPKGVIYPQNQLPDNWINIWRPAYVDPLDRDRQKANQVFLEQSEYQPEPFEAVQIGEQGQSGQGEQGAQQQD